MTLKQRLRLPNKYRGRERHGFEVQLVPVLGMFTLLVLAVFLGYHLDTAPAAETSKVTAKPVANTTTDNETPEEDVDPLPTVAADMQAVISAQSQLQASATLIDLATGKSYSAGNYTERYTAASTAKLVAVFDYINQVEQGKATLDKTIQGQTAQDIIMRMIVYSDNDAWTKLNTYLTMKHEQAYVKGLGLDAVIQAYNVQFSTPDMARLLQLLYEGKLMNDEHRAMVYGYMSSTTMNELIPPALPDDAVIYHKYGQIEGVLHDAAIVEYQGHKFVLVVYTNNSAGDATRYSAQVTLIHDITTAAFNDVIKS